MSSLLHLLQLTFKLVSFLSIAMIPFNSFGYNGLGGYKWDDFKNDWSSPIYQKKAHNVAITGTAITGFLVLFRDQIVEPIQEDVSTNQPLGEWSNFGDIMGQLVPNVLYMGAMYGHGKYTQDELSYKRSLFMLKTSAFSGLTTTILKRIVNQRRPDKGDRLSFPSGHTTTAFAFAAAVGLEHEWFWGLGAYSIASLVGYSRINDNVHYLHDVVFGATIGITYAIALHQAEGLSSNALIYPIFSKEKAGLAWSMLF